MGSSLLPSVLDFIDVILRRRLAYEGSDIRMFYSLRCMLLLDASNRGMNHRPSG